MHLLALLALLAIASMGYLLHSMQMHMVVDIPGPVHRCAFAVIEQHHSKYFRKTKITTHPQYPVQLTAAFKQPAKYRSNHSCLKRFLV